MHSGTAAAIGKSIMEKKQRGRRTSPAKAGLVSMGGEIVPNRWVRFTRAWDWSPPAALPGRATKHFPAGTEIRLTRAQHQSAIAAGAVVSISNPRSAGGGI